MQVIFVHRPFIGLQNSLDNMSTYCQWLIRGLVVGCAGANPGCLRVRGRVRHERIAGPGLLFFFLEVLGLVIVPREVI